MIVIADTSVILNLCCIRQEHLLPALFNQVLVPKQVADEFKRLTSTHKRFRGVSLPVWIKIVASPKTLPSAVVRARLDMGESAAIALCLKQKADALLIDESRGREVAAKLGIRTMGILRILLEAKNSNLITDVKTLLDRLETEANFWVAPKLRLEVLKLAGE